MPWPTTSRHSRGYGREWDRLRKRILDRDGHLCQQCKRDGRIEIGNHVDHIKPKAKGGTDDDTNLQTLCQPCHQAKTDHENAEARGRAPKRRLTFDASGWPIE